MGFKLLHGQEVLDFGRFYPMLERFEVKTQKILLISSPKKDFKLYEWPELGQSVTLGKSRFCCCRDFIPAWKILPCHSSLGIFYSLNETIQL